MKRTFSGIMFTLLLVGMLKFTFDIQPARTEPTTIIVPYDYPTIQGAIDAASSRDNIYVLSGTYSERLEIRKALTLRGENRDTTIIDGNGTGFVIYVYANNVSISGFTIKNSGNSWPGAGIFLLSSGSNVSENTFENNLFAIALFSSSDNILSGNNVKNTYDAGMYFWDSPNNVIIENNVTESGAIGFEIRDHSDNNLFEKNKLTNTTLWGAYIRSSSNNTFGKNVINNGQGGVVLLASSNSNSFDENIIENNSEVGIQMGNSSHNIFSKNTIRNNTLGIHLWSSSSNTFAKNTIGNHTSGIDLYSSNNSTFYYNNLTDNLAHVTLYDSYNTWDNGVEGNYWSDYFGQDLDGDGVGDSNLPHQGVDYFPLMKPWNTMPLFNIAVPPLTTTPNIDGFWSTNEWEDANEYILTGSSGASYIRVKHDGVFLYLLIDSVWDTTNSSVYPYEKTWIAFDTMHNQGSAPKTDDYLFTTSGMIAYVGDGTKWAPMLVPSDFQAQSSSSDEWGPGVQPSPRNSIPHRIEEFKVPLTYVGYPGATVGFYVMVVDDATYHYVEWPTSSGGNPGGWPPIDPCPAPTAWGHIKQLGLPSPMAAFSFSPSTPYAGDVVTLDASASYDPDGCIIDYTWSFGDGNITTVTAPTIIHIFSTDGTYAVNLTVTDNNGKTNWVTHIVSVGAPVAAFSFSPYSPNPSDTVTFDASDSHDHDGTIASYTWNFDDDNTTTISTKMIAHIFSENGRYDVNLTVTDNDGLTDSFVITVAVGALPQIAVPFSTVIPFIDGTWSSWEWNDANEYNITGSGITSYLLVKSDGDYLYIIVDSPWDTVYDPMYGGQWGMEGIYISFDTHHNYGSAPQTDDYLFFSRYSVYMNSWKGDGTHWNTIDTPTAYNAYQRFGTSPHSDATHRIDEYKIPLEYVGPGGFYVIVRDDGSWNGTTFTSWVQWPDGAGGDPTGYPMTPNYRDPCPEPSEWGTLRYVDDVAIINISPSKNIVGEECSMPIEVAIANQGEQTETFSVALYANLTAIDFLASLTLSGGNSTTIILTWNTTGFSCGQYTISAYASPVLGEIDTADNTCTDGTVTVTIQGDLNGDGIVNIQDVLIAAIALGSYPEHPKWNPHADWNSDEIINILDLVVVGVNFGKTW